MSMKILRLAVFGKLVQGPAAKTDQFAIFIRFFAATPCFEQTGVDSERKGRARSAKIYFSILWRILLTCAFFFRIFYAHRFVKQTMLFQNDCGHLRFLFPDFFWR